MKKGDEGYLVAIIPFTSLWQWIDTVGESLDDHIETIISKPYRCQSSESFVPMGLPYMRFKKRESVDLTMNYSRERFKAPFKTEDVMKVCVSKGIDDCQIETVTLHFVDGTPPLNYKDYKAAFTTKTVKLSTGVGRYVMKLREDFLEKKGAEEPRKIKPGELRQLELEHVILNGRRLSLEEQTDSEFLRWLQSRAKGLILVKKVLPHTLTAFRDSIIVDSIFDKERDEEEEFVEKLEGI